MHSPDVLIAAPHRYPDLARLWYRAVARDLLPAFESRGLRPAVTIFCDDPDAGFEPGWFPRADLERPSAGARDFIEFYDAALARDSDLLLLIDADVFFLDGDWPMSCLGAFDDPRVAAVSFLNRAGLPGSVYALLCRTAYYRELPPPVFAACYERVEDWPHATHRDPGERAALCLGRAGRTVVRAEGAEEHLADFHGTTNVRASRELFGDAIGAARFHALMLEKPYFLAGAYDNLLLGTLYRVLFGEPFAPDARGAHLAGSLTVDSFERLLASVGDAATRARLDEGFRRSEGALRRLAAREGIAATSPVAWPAGWRS